MKCPRARPHRCASGRCTPSRSPRRRRRRSRSARSRCGRCRGTPGSARARRSALTMRDLLAERIERERHRELRADRVAVRPGVRGDQETLAARISSQIWLDGLGSAFGARSSVRSSFPGRHRPAARCSAGSASAVRSWISSMIRSMRSCVSIDSSKKNSSSGTRFSRSRRPICRRRNGVARSSARAVSFRAFSSPSVV